MRVRRMSPRWLAAAVLLALVLVPVGVAASERMGRREATATLRDTHGTVVGQVRLEDRGGGRTRVRVRASGLSPGFHGFHLHAVGVCDPNAVDPATGRVTPFFSAGGHHNPAATSHPAHGGDLPVLFADQRGRAAAEAVTDRFGVRGLLAGDGSAVIVHALPDNYANIPTRYRSAQAGTPGPDADTLKTGDSGARVVCGVVKRR
jgi:superoxide dismutase, Cu-Zn family